MLVNVLDNAVKYSPPGGSVFLTLRRAGAEMTVTVRDQGRGISPEDLEHVKQKFFKGRNAVRGSGIGLAVVDSIVTAFGGRVDIASTLGQGTTVSYRAARLSPRAGSAAQADLTLRGRPCDHKKELYSWQTKTNRHSFEPPLADRR